MSGLPITAGPPLSVGDVIAHVAAEQAAELRKHGRDARKKGDVEAIHDMRVATRRLRTALRSVKEQVDAPRRLRRGLKRLARRLGRVRDHDVMLALLGSVRLADAREQGRLDRLVERLTERRAKTHRALRRTLKQKRHARLLDRLDDFAEHPRERGGEFMLATRVMAEVSEGLGRRVAARAGMTAASPTPAALHQLRIGFKRLRYALDVHASACGLAYDVERRMARAMQDVLGEIHDRDLLLAWLARGRKPFAGRWPGLVRRMETERARLMRRFRRLRREWIDRTRPEPSVAPVEEPRFVNLEVQRVGLRLVATA